MVPPAERLLAVEVALSGALQLVSLDPCRERGIALVAGTCHSFSSGFTIVIVISLVTTTIYNNAAVRVHLRHRLAEKKIFKK